jgi:hypothetical protein
MLLFSSHLAMLAINIMYIKQELYLGLHCFWYAFQNVVDQEKGGFLGSLLAPIASVVAPLLSALFQ